MVKKKKPYIIECECGMKIKGFSKHHAEMNLMIHKKTSIKHRERMELIKKHKKS